MEPSPLGNDVVVGSNAVAVKDEGEVVSGEMLEEVEATVSDSGVFGSVVVNVVVVVIGAGDSVK